MNTGIQNSVNLGWKLARVLRGQQPDGFLDSYHEERWPVSQHLLAKTDQMFSLLTSTSKTFQALRDLALPMIAPRISKWAQASNAVHYLSQLGIKYRPSQIVHTGSDFEGPVRGGFRAPEGRVLFAGGEETWLLNVLRGAMHQLVVFSDDAAWQAEDAAQRFRDALKEEV